MTPVGQRPCVLFLLDWQPVPWGTREEFFRQLCAELAARGVVPVFTIPKIYAPEIRERMEAAGAVVAVQSYTKGSLAYHAHIRRIADEYDVRLAHIRYFTLDSPVAWLCRLAGIRELFYTEANGGEWVRGGPMEWLRRLRARVLHAPLTRVIAISRFVRERLAAQGVAPERMTLVYNGVNLATFRPDATARTAVRAHMGAGPGTVCLLFASKPLPIKRPRVALAVLAELARRGVDAQLWIAGIGTMVEELTAEAARLGVGARLRVIGHQPDIERWMAAADALLHTTVGEAFGNVFVEAMACGLPVVATRAGAAPELVTDGVTGQLVPPGPDEVVQLADAVDALMRDPARRTAMAEAGVVHARPFSLERCVRGTLALYEPLLPPRPQA